MIYLDYSATTKINDEVLDTYIKVSRNYIGNSNSLHKLGIESREIEKSATEQIASLLKVNDSGIIYTSGASESNNLAIKGLLDAYPKRGRHIITTKLEHSSVLEPLKTLEGKGYKISYAKLTKDGLIDLDDLERLINDETILVTIASVSSEIGLKQNISEVSKIVKKYPRCFLHVDATQSIGKVDIDLSGADLISLSAHKFYGPKGIGLLIKKDNVLLKSQIEGGDSTTSYRSGTPALPLIVSMAKALRLALENLNDKYNYVEILNNNLREYFKGYSNIHINSTDKSIPHILNISLNNIKPETMLHALEENDIYISTKSACSSSKNYSLSVLELTNNKDFAKTSIRISLSYLTTKEEIEIFKQIFDKCYRRLNFR